MTPTRTDHFVPLTTAPLASTGPRAGFKATVVSQPVQVQKFQSAPAISGASAAPMTLRSAQCEPRVSVQREGNRITGIQVQCSCGEVIQLACVYEGAAAESAPAPQPATNPQPEAAKALPGKKGKETGKDLPTSASTTPKSA